MYDKELVLEILAQIHTAAQRIARRFQNIREAEDLVSSEEGIDKLDGICMQLIVIGESLKNLDRITNQTPSCSFPARRLEERERHTRRYHPPLYRSGRAGGF
jgi:uncharacterized protein with HEPN domain